MELVVVLAIISIVVAVALPSTLHGLENIRLASGAQSVAAFMTSALNRAQRHELALELSVSIKENAMIVRSADSSYFKKLVLPPGIRVQSVTPALEEPADAPRRFLFLPGGAPPRVGIQIADKRGAWRTVWLDPITGITRIDRPEGQ